MTDATTTPAKATRAKAAATEAHPSDGKNIIQILDAIAHEAGALEKQASGGGVPFPYRGIDGVINHLSPLLRKYGVIFTDKVIHKSVTSAPSGNKVVTMTDLTILFTFYAPDGSSIPTEVAGLATDYGDRSTAQAHSVALRIALLQLFALPTQSPDPEETGVEREAPPVQTQQPLAQKNAGQPTAREAQAIVKKEWETIHGEGDIGYVTLGNKMFAPDTQAEWANEVPKLKQLVDAIRKGEVAEAA